MNAIYIAWRPVDEYHSWRPVARIERIASRFRLFYTVGARLTGFAPFVEFPSLDEVYESEELFPALAAELFDDARTDYEQYFRSGGFFEFAPPDPVITFDPFGRENDVAEVFPQPQLFQQRDYCNTFYLHGLQWEGPLAWNRIDFLEEDEELRLMHDFQNEYDYDSVAVRTEDDRVLIGYVPRYFAKEIAFLVRECRTAMKIFVKRSDLFAPLESKLLCTIQTEWPKDFVTCQDELFSPIPDIAESA